MHLHSPKLALPIQHRAVYIFWHSSNMKTGNTHILVSDRGISSQQMILAIPKSPLLSYLFIWNDDGSPFFSSSEQPFVFLFVL